MVIGSHKGIYRHLHVCVPVHIILRCIVILIETTFLVFRRFKTIKTGKRKVFIDTSALIDGRILGVAKTGFLDGDFVILKSVLRELQLLADGKDSEKRTNGNKKKFNSIYGTGTIEGQKVVLLKPQTYKNLSGNAVRDFIISQLPENTEYSVDAMGNLIVFAKGRKPAKNKVMLAAHMDEVGFMGAFSGGVSATSAGISAAIVSGAVAALVSRPRPK